MKSDFNAITFHSKHRGGSFYHYASKPSYFVDFITCNTLLDIDFISMDHIGAMVREV